MINAIVWAAVVVMWGYVAAHVAQRILRDKRTRRKIELEREFIGAVSRESQAGLDLRMRCWRQRNLLMMKP